MSYSFANMWAKSEVIGKYIDFSGFQMIYLSLAWPLFSATTEHTELIKIQS